MEHTVKGTKTQYRTINIYHETTMDLTFARCYRYEEGMNIDHVQHY